MPEDVGWRGGRGWFHTVCHGLLVGAVTVHAPVRPNVVHLQIWAFAICIFVCVVPRSRRAVSPQWSSWLRPHMALLVDARARG